MKTVIISQARMTSARLPGKVLKEVLGKSLLMYQIDRLRRVCLADEVVVATTTNATDDAIEAVCNRENVLCFRGSEVDVLSRYYETAKRYEADTVVRVTSDCPLIDPMVVNTVIDTYKENNRSFDYVSNVLDRTFPRGMDTEVFSFTVLAEAYREAYLKQHREHVTPFIYSQPERYRLGGVRNSSDKSGYRWTVDTAEDFELIKHILEIIYPQIPNFGMEDCFAAYESNPRWYTINNHIEQKKT